MPQGSETKTVNWKGRPSTKSSLARAPSRRERPSSMWKVSRTELFFWGIISFQGRGVSKLRPGDR